MADEHLISLQPGTVIAGRYEVVKCLGAGSMGLVYACRHRELSGHIVAIKVLFPEVAQDKVAAARFRNEIFASYGVSHPNVVRAYEYIRDGDLVAYTMEYVGGGDLADRLGKGSDELAIPDIVRLLSQMCAGVQAIHDAGIIHRDLKPENILITKDGNVKIADFGIARTGHGQRLTEHGGVVGTIDYVSPEYMLNSQVDWRSDIYALGILAYEMVAGESPFQGDSVYAKMTNRLKADPPPPSTLRASCPKELDSIVLRAMARNPEERYQSAEEMFRDLQSLSSGSHPVVQPMSTARSGPLIAPKSSGANRVVEPIASPVPSEPSRATPAPSVLPSGGAAPIVPRRPAPAERAAPRSVTAPSTQKTSDGISSTEEFEIAAQYGARYDRGGAQGASFSNQTQAVPVPGRAPIDPSPQNDNGATIYEPVRMERVLAYNDPVTDGWSRIAGGVDVAGGGKLDEKRLQRLSQMAYQGNRSLWLDVVTVVAAVLIGVGIGYLLLKMYWPDLVRSRVGGQSSVSQEW